MKKPLVLAAALILAAPYVCAQERQLNEASGKTVCEVADAFTAWKPSGADPNLRMNVETIARRLAQACALQPDFTDAAQNREWASWLLLLDHIAQDVDFSVADRFSEPIGAKDRPAIALLLQASGRMQLAIGPLRAKAYTAVREVPKEVIRTFEVEAKCAACPDVRCPEPPPQVVQVDPVDDERAGCLSAAHDTARQAKIALDKINYANGSLSAIRDLASSLGECTQWSFSNEPQCPKSIFQRLPGWARMADGILERDTRLNADQQMSPDTRGRVEGVATALRSQLRTCGRF